MADNALKERISALMQQKGNRLLPIRDIHARLSAADGRNSRQVEFALRRALHLHRILTRSDRRMRASGADIGFGIAVVLVLLLLVNFLPPDTSLSEVKAKGAIRACVPTAYPPLVTGDRC